ncbi:hypothetical protein BPUTSESOX_28 [uncultured Gammaproteobacteria bacterium]|nr:hypothetical protein [uncultured Gammaproteobacteria bacterium]CAC9578332.1 hypothetical protein [uncultured Gammaproteobacteria bacterium]CAC9626400.1 hypothetical protein [uncultured Gammaproteobacteria bacterium]VVH51765.1 hypothetical protein BPUTSESOX_28 [uncultured Gammaproteobacteria bacterium]
MIGFSKNLRRTTKKFSNFINQLPVTIKNEVEKIRSLQ